MGTGIRDPRNPSAALTRTVTTSTATLGTNDSEIFVNFAGAVTITLPGGGRSIDGFTYIIKDTSNAASTNNITILPNGSDLIEGTSSFVISIDRGAVVLAYSVAAAGWEVLDKTVAASGTTGATGTYAFDGGNFTAANGLVTAATSMHKTQTVSPSSTYTADPTLGEVIYIILSTSLTLTVNSGQDGDLLTLIFVQPGAGNCLLSTPFPVNVVLAGNDFVLSKGGNKVDTLTLRYDGINSVWRELSRTNSFLSTVGGFQAATTLVDNSSANPFPLTTDHFLILCYHSSGGTCQINLPQSPPEGTTYWIKDIAGLAFTQPIVVNGTPSANQYIDGVSPYNINRDYGWVQLVFGQGRWSVLAQSSILDFSQTPGFSAAMTIDPGLGDLVHLNMSGPLNGAWTIASGTKDGQLLTLLFHQDATGGRWVTNPGLSNVSWLGNNTPVLSISANATDRVNLRWSETDSKWHEVARDLGHVRPDAGMLGHSRIITASTDSPTLDDYILHVNYSSAVTITLPGGGSAAQNDGQIYVIKDISGAAGSNNITISFSSIDGASSIAIAENYGWRVLAYHVASSQYRVISSSAAVAVTSGLTGTISTIDTIASYTNGLLNGCTDYNFTQAVAATTLNGGTANVSSGNLMVISMNNHISSWQFGPGIWDGQILSMVFLQNGGGGYTVPTSVSGGAGVQFLNNSFVIDTANTHSTGANFRWDAPATTWYELARTPQNGTIVSGLSATLNTIDSQVGLSLGAVQSWTDYNATQTTSATTLNGGTLSVTSGNNVVVNMNGNIGSWNFAGGYWDAQLMTVMFVQNSGGGYTVPANVSGGATVQFINSALAIDPTNNHTTGSVFRWDAAVSTWYEIARSPQDGAIVSVAGLSSSITTIDSQVSIANGLVKGWTVYNFVQSQNASAVNNSTISASNGNYLVVAMNQSISTWTFSPGSWDGELFNILFVQSSGGGYTVPANVSAGATVVFFHGNLVIDTTNTHTTGCTFRWNAGASTWYEIARTPEAGGETGVTAGSYANPTVTVDTLGRITGVTAGSGMSSSINTIDSSVSIGSGLIQAWTDYNFTQSQTSGTLNGTTVAPSSGNNLVCDLTGGSVSSWTFAAGNWDGQLFTTTFFQSGSGGATMPANTSGGATVKFLAGSFSVDTIANHSSASIFRWDANNSTWYEISRTPGMGLTSTIETIDSVVTLQSGLVTGWTDYNSNQALSPGTGTLNFSPSSGNLMVVSMTGNVSTWTFSSGYDGQLATMIFIQDATGTRTLPAASGSTVAFLGGSFVLDVTPNAVTSANFRWDAASSTWREISRNPGPLLPTAVSAGSYQYDSSGTTLLSGGGFTVGADGRLTAASSGSPIAVGTAGTYQFDTTGNVTGSITTDTYGRVSAATAGALQTTGVTAGTYSPPLSITVDAYGRITAIS